MISKQLNNRLYQHQHKLAYANRKVIFLIKKHINRKHDRCIGAYSQKKVGLICILVEISTASPLICMKNIVWILAILGIITNLFTIIMTLYSGPVSTTTISFGAALAFVWTNQKFREDRNLYIVSRLALLTFIVALGVFIWSRFYR